MSSSFGGAGGRGWGETYLAEGTLSAWGLETAHTEAHPGAGRSLSLLCGAGRRPPVDWSLPTCPDPLSASLPCGVGCRGPSALSTSSSGEPGHGREGQSRRGCPSPRPSTWG